MTVKKIPYVDSFIAKQGHDSFGQLVTIFVTNLYFLSLK